MKHSVTTWLWHILLASSRKFKRISWGLTDKKQNEIRKKIAQNFNVLKWMRNVEWPLRVEHIYRYQFVVAAVVVLQSDLGSDMDMDMDMD